jgi:uncharacterized membrane protein
MKKLFILALVVLTLAAMTVTAVASTTPSDDVAEAFGEAMTNMRGDVISLMLVALPVGLGIFALFFGVRKGIKMLRSTTG